MGHLPTHDQHKSEHDPRDNQQGTDYHPELRRKLVAWRRLGYEHGIDEYGTDEDNDEERNPE